MRLRGHRCFNRLHRSGRRHHGDWMVLRVISEDPRLLRPELRRHPTRCCRCALVISSKVSKRAVVRNRLRRRLHAHLRSRFEQAPEHGAIWLLLSLKPGVAPESHALLEECDRLLEQAGLTT